MSALGTTARRNWDGAGRLPERPLLQPVRWALAVTAAAAPAYVLRWHAGPLPTTLLENVILLTLALYVLARWQAGRLGLVRTRYDVAILLFLVAGAIGVLVAPNHRAALGIYRAYLIEPVAIYYVVVDVVRRPRHFEWCILGLGAAGAALAVLNAVEFVRVAQAGLLNLVAFVPVAVFTTANAVAMFLEPLIAIAVGFVLFGVDRRSRLGGLMFLLLFLPAEFLTFSRGGFLALLALLLVVILSVKRKLEVGLAALGAGAILVWRVPMLAERIGRELNLHDPYNTLATRLTLWTSTLRMLRDHPVFGVGISAFQVRVRPYLPAGAPTDSIYPHTLWLTFWSELGLLGLAAFTVIFVGLLWRGARSLSTAAPWQRPILWGIVATLAMIAAHGLVDIPYWKNDLSLEFWLLAGMEVALLMGAASSRAGQEGVSASSPGGPGHGQVPPSGEP